MRNNRKSPLSGSGTFDTGNVILSCISIVLMLFFPVALSFAASIELRQTGQTACWDSSGNPVECIGTGQDADKLQGAAWPDPRFEDSGDGTVTDNLTGLIWTKDAYPAGELLDWEEALDYVAAMNNADGGAGTYGHNDWRLPTRSELQSLVHAAQAPLAPWLNAQGFVNVHPDYYWSSTTNAPNTLMAWVINLYDGDVSAHNKVSPYLIDALYVWPVRGGQSGVADPSYPANIPKTGQSTSYYPGDDGDLQKGVSWPSPRFTDNGNGTVTDSLTGLIWLKNGNCTDTVGGIAKGGGTLSWMYALTWSNNLANGNCGLTDYSSAGQWRLPNREELLSLIDSSRQRPAMAVDHPFTDMKTGYYWSSTAYTPYTAAAWSISIYLGGLYAYFKSDSFYVLPVRAGGLFGNPVISFSPSSHDFGIVDPNTSSDPQSFTLTNSGTNNLYINTITITGTNPNQFSIQNDTCSNTMIAPSGTCTLQVVFSPTLGGEKHASFRILSNAAGSPPAVDLWGTGTVPPVCYSISYVMSGSGDLACIPNPVCDTSTSFCTATPDPGYRITSASGCDGADPGPQPPDSTYEYETGPMIADCTVTVRFEPNSVPGCTMVWRTGGHCYTEIQSAYNEASSSDVIKTGISEFVETLDCNLDKTLTLQGGWDWESNTTSGWTTVHGSLSVSAGTVIAANLMII